MGENTDRKCNACGIIVEVGNIQECPVCSGTLVFLGYNSYPESKSEPKPEPKPEKVKAIPKAKKKKG